MNSRIQFLILFVIFFGIVQQYTGVVNAQEEKQYFRINEQGDWFNNFNVVAGIRYRFRSRCWDHLHNLWHGYMWDSVSTFTPPKSVFYESNYTTLNHSYVNYAVDTAFGNGLDQWRDLVFFIPGLVVWNQTGYCPLGLRTHFAYINVTIPVTVHNQMELTVPPGVPAYYNSDDWSKAYVSWTSPSGKQLSVQNDITNPTSYNIEFGYVVTFGRNYEAFDYDGFYRYTIMGGSPSGFLAPTPTTLPITPITMFAPGERKLTNPYYYNLNYNISNCSDVYPNEPVMRFELDSAPKFHLMMKQYPPLPYSWTQSFWVPIAEADLHNSYHLKYNLDIQNYDLIPHPDGYYSIPVPYHNGGGMQFLMPEWDNFIENRANYRKTAAAPHCLAYTGPS